MATTIILTEDALTDADVQHIQGLQVDPPERYRVLVPEDTDANVVAAIIDHLWTGELREAGEDLVGREPTEEQAKATATERLERSLELLRAAGAVADGHVTQEDPLPALTAAVAAEGGPEGVQGVVVVTYPHVVADTLRRDWASRAREELRAPVLHLYAGTSAIGD
ncbi:hypothetical protein [Isoptericola cucumis]|uniref:Uncharacterized protein n=1 Tax=Isoptericola cucumis TaxID=1776856 RepID=A0ABQ2B9Z9_9MICO|nr:hypothetical protein [Isoptericola cucumis]GGI11289.1 hypothetical protein GCM10007368_35460 [Isoptericola cucumis]